MKKVLLYEKNFSAMVDRLAGSFTCVVCHRTFYPWENWDGTLNTDLCPFCKIARKFQTTRRVENGSN